MKESPNKIIKHLEMLQGVINRMAHNSFLLKSWAITLTAASFWLLGRGTFPDGGKLGIMAIIFIFWGLDAYYLRQERLFRKLYNHVRKQNAEKECDYFSMDYSAFEREVSPWWEMCYNPCENKTGFAFYTMLQFVILILL